MDNITDNTTDNTADPGLAVALYFFFFLASRRFQYYFPRRCLLDSFLAIFFFFDIKRHFVEGFVDNSFIFISFTLTPFVFQKDQIETQHDGCLTRKRKSFRVPVPSCILQLTIHFELFDVRCDS